MTSVDFPTYTEPDARVIVETATSAAGERQLDVEKVYGVTVPRGTEHHVVDLEQFAMEPRRARGSRSFFTAESFAAYVNKHKDAAASTIWADVERSAVTAVLNDHSTEVPGWGDHLAVLSLRLTPAWRRWVKRDGVIGSQAEFAEHIEDSLPDIVEPTGATMLELAQSFHAKGNVTFKSDQRLNSGAVALQYEETVEARAGERGQLTVPQKFVIGIAPFEGMDLFRIDVRLRYRLREGKLSIGYVLDRPEDVQREAFGQVVDGIGEQTEIAVWQGQA